MEIHNQNTANVKPANSGADKAANQPASQTDSMSNQTVQATTNQLKNAAILSAQHDAELSAGNEPMRLLYKAAIEAINEELAPVMGERAIETAVEEGVDTSPQATADRIVSFATQFFSIYQQQNASMEYEEQLDSFMEVIGGAIDQGFDEAKEILTSLKVLEGDIALGVDETYSIVQAGLADFRQSMLSTNDDVNEAEQSQ
ncbi:DUF5610 domain-containing protein [Shewanella waksmanii]|uniref:DUF5610 domain-containing protein n=1 Tax=Shewanella waksmanii TaxID=213783 RepID=UPI0037360C75